VFLIKCFESRYDLVVLNKYNQYGKKRIISLLILLELLLKDIGFVIRILDSNRGSSGFRLYIRGGGITSTSIYMSAMSI
jgi:hypothetical protein